jgi:hypothetical protein
MEDFNFLDYPVKLYFDENLIKNIKIDLRPKITYAHGLNVGGINTLKEAVKIPDNYFELIDRGSLYSEIISYKINKGLYNLEVDKEVLKQIILSKNYKIFIAETPGIKIENSVSTPVLKIVSFEGIGKFYDLVLMILKEYIQKFYRREEKRKTMDYLEVEPLSVDQHSDMFPENNEIIIKIPKNLTKDITQIIEQLKKYNLDKDEIPEEWENWKNSFVIHFDNHLYTPLIIWKQNKEKIKSIPVKLNKGETKFVSDFRDYLTRNKPC